MAYRIKQRIPNRGISHGQEILKVFNVLSNQRNANHNGTEIPPYTIRMAKIKNSSNSICWWGCGAGGTFLLVRMKTCTIILEINLAVFQKIMNSSSWRPSYTTPGCIPKDTWLYQRSTCSAMFISLICNTQELEIFVVLIRSA